MNTNSRFIYTIYAIFFVAYLTLSSTAPILLTISQKSHISMTDLQLGVSLLFFFFSVSSIVLGPVSDFVGRRNVLLIAQSVSFIGLVLCAFSDSFYTFTFGLIIIGLGTGAFSVVSRSIVNHAIKDHHLLFKAYTSFSVLVIAGPIVATKMSIEMAQFLNWHLIYAVLAVLVLCVLFSTYKNTHEPDKAFKPSRVNVKGITEQFLYCAKNPLFMKNAILVGLFFSVILGLFLGFGPEIFIKRFHVSTSDYSNIALFICIAYLVGNMISKHIGSRVDKRHLKFVAFAVVAMATLILSTHNSLDYTVGTFFTIGVGAGMLGPMGTHGGMKVLDKHFGTAAAMFTALFSIFSALWSYLHAVLNIDALTLITVILWCIVIGCTVFELVKPDQESPKPQSNKHTIQHQKAA
ncbi:MFS transporter [Vibrio marisflavi]|uniref:Multidrug resistance protein MdtL n=1 Tax=Vibrio marisflavi CECT 7928 TaxID=634439 RepID=A0ABM9A6V0_9VIBR|nr:MFS transporter [Vibrio marisflavi]CAH0541047.1 Multidrug resistance protein MdtL [Vibrio marisflavi CECT 7928]